jgi:hypothetical protein
MVPHSRTCWPEKLLDSHLALLDSLGARGPGQSPRPPRKWRCRASRASPDRRPKWSGRPRSHGSGWPSPRRPDRRALWAGACRDAAKVGDQVVPGVGDAALIELILHGLSTFGLQRISGVFRCQACTGQRRTSSLNACSWTGQSCRWLDRSPLRRATPMSQPQDRCEPD